MQQLRKGGGLNDYIQFQRVVTILLTASGKKDNPAQASNIGFARDNIWCWQEITSSFLKYIGEWMLNPPDTDRDKFYERDETIRKILQPEKTTANC